MSTSAFDVITGGTPITDDLVLSSEFEIEEVLIQLSELNSKLEHAKGLKKYRVETADIEIKYLTEKIEQFRRLVQNTMFTLTPNEKSLQFPAIAKVVKRKGTDGWKIEDEAEFLKHVRNEHKADYDKIIKVKQSIDSRAAKKMIEDWTESEDVPGVKKVIGSESISITFDSDAPKLSKVSTVKTTAKALPAAKTHPAKPVKQDLDELDNLDV